ncbi:hypothetical protein [Paraliomyxa miuraensis]|uniref:hypothetical protein n=1 Tax=Paraliomyxa miuraensis TaxID=376150 RepID=UPI002253867E|nr:hypothetical protein [Paraliomyxa miuraensis]MCX4244710.1 hypothetical protein [Paraliomyxa miuraensis]
MSHPVILERVGSHVIDQLEQVVTLAQSPDSGIDVGVWLQSVEVAIPFATSDGSDVSPATIVVGETPLPPAAARELLQPLQQLVFVRVTDLQAAAPGARGVLVMRVTLPHLEITNSPSDDPNPNP